MVNCVTKKAENALGSFSTNASCQLDVLWHDGHTLGVDGAQVGVLEQADQVGLGGFLQTNRSCIGDYLEPETALSYTWRAPMAALWNLRSVLKS